MLNNVTATVGSCEFINKYLTTQSFNRRGCHEMLFGSARKEMVSVRN